MPKTSPVAAMPVAFEHIVDPPAMLGAPQSAWTQARVQQALAYVDFDLGAGKVVEARDGAERIRVAAVAAGDDSLAGWALGQRGWAELGLRDFATARITFTSLVEQSQRRGDDVQLTYGALGMLEVDREEGQHERALRWADEAEVAASRAAMPIDTIITLQISRATIAYARGDFDSSEMGFREALDLSDDSVPGMRVQALMLNNLGAIQGRRHHFEQAAVLLAESAQLYGELLPEDDPDLVAVETNLGLNLVKAGDTAGGVDLAYAALARVQRTHVAPDPILADTHLIVADTLFEANDNRACLRHATAALAMIDRVEVPALVKVGAPYRVCVCALRLGDIAGAEAAGARAVTLLETVDVDSTLATAARFAYAKAAAAAGRTQIARRVAARAVETSPDPATTQEITAWVAAL